MVVPTTNRRLRGCARQIGATSELVQRVNVVLDEAVARRLLLGAKHRGGSTKSRNEPCGAGFCWAQARPGHGGEAGLRRKRRF